MTTSALVDETYLQLEGDRGMSRTPEQRRTAWRRPAASQPADA